MTPAPEDEPPADAPYNRVSALCGDGKPYEQGELDGLCGVYAAVNALALLVARGKPLAKSYCTELFHQGIGIVAKDIALQEVITTGIEPELWIKVVQGLAAQVASDVELGIAAVQPFADRPQVRFAELRQRIEAALDRDALVLVLLKGVHDHYTVVSSHSDTRFILYDSAGLYWLTKAKCGSERSQQRHRLNASATIFIELVV